MKNIQKIDISFVLYFGAMVYALFFTPRFFGTNDDMLMMLFASGLYTGSPSEYIVFENILLGQLFKVLYGVFPSINWYVFILTGVQLVTFTVLYFLMKRMLSKQVLLFLFVLPMLYFIVEFTVYLQFTKVAFLPAIVGLIYITLALHEKRNVYLVYAFMFFVVAYLVREHSVYGAVLLALPLGLFMLLRNSKQFLHLRFLGFLLLLASTLFMLNTYSHTYYDNSKAWKNYKELIDIRGYIYYDRSITKECFSKEGQVYDISKNDVETYYKWTNDDRAVFIPALLKHITSQCSKGTSGQFEKIQHKRFVAHFIEKLSSFDFIFIFVLFVYLFLVTPHRYKVLSLFMRVYKL